MFKSFSSSSGVVHAQSLSRRGEIKVVDHQSPGCSAVRRARRVLRREAAELPGQLAHVPDRLAGLMSHDHVPFIAEYIRGGVRARWQESSSGLSKHNIDRVERWERDGDEILAHIPNR